MREQCIRAVESAMGMDREQLARRWGSTWANDIETKIRSAQKQAARQDPESFRALAPEAQLTEAARLAAQENDVQAAKRVQRAEAAILAYDRNQHYIQTQVANGADANPLRAQERILRHKYDEAGNSIDSIESAADARFNAAYAQISQVFDKLNPGLWNQMLEGKLFRMHEIRRTMVAALHGVENVPAEFKRWADQVHEVIDAWREEFNAKGGVVGRLEDWGMWNSWSGRMLERGYEGYAADDLKLRALTAGMQFDAARALRAEMEQKAQRAFVDFMAQRANRRRYVHEDGSYFNDAELRDFFAEAYNTIVSDGWSKPGEEVTAFPGGAVKANRGSQHRVIHLQPEAYADALARYSEQNVLEGLMGGMHRMARDISLVERLGPNPDFMWKKLTEDSMREIGRINPSLAPKLEGYRRHLDYLYNSLAGNNPRVANRAVADLFATARNLQVFKLAKALISSFNDMANVLRTAMQNKLNAAKVVLNASTQFLPGSRRYTRRLGLGVETMLADLERMSGENLSSRTLTAKTASGVLRASGLTFWTNMWRNGFGMTLMDSLGHLTRQYARVDQLHFSDHGVIAAKGVDQATWDIWRAAEIDNWGANHTLLTPEKIMEVSGPSVEAKRQAVIKLLAIIRDERDIAVLEPRLKERVTGRTWLAGEKGMIAGDVGGEIARSGFLFKSFTLTQNIRNWERSGLYARTRFGRYGYMAQMFVAATMLYAVSQWIRDLIAGKDPRPMWGDMNDPRMRSIVIRNWFTAMIGGGGVGFYGDFLFNEQHQGTGSTLGESMLGPLGTTAGSLIDLTTGSAAEYAAGNDAHAGAKAVNLLRSSTPFTNLPYTQALADRAIWYQMMDWASPGSVDRMTSNQANRENTSYWWLPQDNALQGQGPERAPDWGHAVGNN